MVKATPKPIARQQAKAQGNIDDLKATDEGYQLARSNAVKYLHSRRQAIFALARHFHLDADDLQQESYEVLLTCLRDFNPIYVKSDGSTVTVQFNTFGNRLEGKALEQRNRDPEYQARQAHPQDMSDEDRSEFRKNPPLLVQHLDQETTLQENLRGEVAAAQRSRQTNMALKNRAGQLHRAQTQRPYRGGEGRQAPCRPHARQGRRGQLVRGNRLPLRCHGFPCQPDSERTDGRLYVQRLLDGDLK